MAVAAIAGASKNKGSKNYCSISLAHQSTAPIKDMLVEQVEHPFYALSLH